MDILDRLTPEELQVVERRYTIEVEIAEIESEIDARRGNPLEVEKLLRKLSYLERQKNAIGRERPSRILAFQQRLDMDLLVA